MESDEGASDPLDSGPIDAAPIDTDPIDAAWERVLEAWDDPKAHQAFIALAAGMDRLAEAGRRYRDVREKDPARADTARAQIDRVIGMAMQNLTVLKTEPPGPSAKAKMILVAIGMSGAMIASALWVLLRWL